MTDILNPGPEVLNTPDAQDTAIRNLMALLKVDYAGHNAAFDPAKNLARGDPLYMHSINDAKTDGIDTELGESTFGDDTTRLWGYLSFPYTPEIVALDRTPELLDHCVKVQIHTKPFTDDTSNGETDRAFVAFKDKATGKWKFADRSYDLGSNTDASAPDEINQFLLSFGRDTRRR